MLLYFYHSYEKSNKIRETAVEVIETKKMYRSATDVNFPGLYKRKIEKTELNKVIRDYFCADLIFISEIKNADLARDAILEYCERKYRAAEEEAEKWRNRSDAVRTEKLVREHINAEEPTRNGGQP